MITETSRNNAPKWTNIEAKTSEAEKVRAREREIARSGHVLKLQRCRHKKNIARNVDSTNIPTVPALETLIAIRALRLKITYLEQLYVRGV